MIPTSPEHVWVSRVRAPHFRDQMGFDAGLANEIPHVRGLPVDIALPSEAFVVREWPNLAGRLEPVSGDDIVRWNPSLAPAPSTANVVRGGDEVNKGDLADMTLWMARFARALTQIPGVTLAAPSDSPRLIILTPHGLPNRTDLPTGMLAVPDRLGEFPGGIVLTMDPTSFEHRAEYAGIVEAIIREG